ncbi:MAG TPA: PocR ligand-binding domain-containing protein [Thermoanaerobaculia bacterium]|nr:PocR ligand-binding domain-containing protein [Thermoanaerobaculia bacterium]HUM28506.1 PocR ligand-binding domain-containing protein [Thermoanaerobaculia bacterium]HXK66886.1 PocR ligand-binding domain-containing protein [Thermoanaerobaculia bacterium]
MRDALKDYFLSGAWKEFVRDVSNFLDSNLCYLVMDYRENLWSTDNTNPICMATQSSTKGRRLCRDDREAIHRLCFERGNTTFSVCHMNFTRFNIPIQISDGSTISFGMCGLRCHRSLPATVLDHGEALGWKREELIRLYETNPMIPPEKLREFCRILNHLFSSITELVQLKEGLKQLLDGDKASGVA